MSTKLTRIRLVAVELEIGRKTAAKGAETPQELVASRRPGNTELPGVGDMNLDLIAVLKFKRIDDSGGKADSETISPLSNFQCDDPREIRLNRMYICKWPNSRTAGTAAMSLKG